MREGRWIALATSDLVKLVALDLAVDTPPQKAPASAVAFARQRDVVDGVVTANCEDDLPGLARPVNGDLFTRPNLHPVEKLARKRAKPSSAGQSGFGILNIRDIGIAALSRSAECNIGTVANGIALASTSFNSPLPFNARRARYHRRAEEPCLPRRLGESKQCRATSLPLNRTGALPGHHPDRKHK